MYTIFENQQIFPQQLYIWFRCWVTPLEFHQNLYSVSKIVATYDSERWTLRKNEETRLDAFEMKGLRKILGVSWTAKKQVIEWVLKKAGVKTKLLDTVKARKLA